MYKAVIKQLLRVTRVEITMDAYDSIEATLDSKFQWKKTEKNTILAYIKEEEFWTKLQDRFHINQASTRENDRILHHALEEFEKALRKA